MDVADQLQDAAVNADCPCDNARDDPKACGRAADGLPNPGGGNAASALSPLIGEVLSTFVDG